MALAVDVGLAALSGGVTRQDGPRLHAQREPADRPGRGDLYLLVQGGSDRQAASFGQAVATSYFADESEGIANALVQSMRHAAQSASIDMDLASPGEPLGATGAVHAGDQLYLAQLLPSQVFVLRDGILNALPSELPPTSLGDPAPDQEVEIFRVELDPDDVVVLASTEFRRALTDREIQGLLQGRSAQRAAHDICSVVTQRGSVSCDIVVLRVSVAAPAAVTAPAADERWMSASSTSAASTNGLARPPQASAVPEQPLYPRERLAGDGPQRSAVQRLVALPVTLVLMLLVLPVMAVRGLVRLVTGQSEPVQPTIPPPAPTPTAATTGGAGEMDDDWSSLRSLRAAGPGGEERPGAARPQTPPALSAVGEPLRGGQDAYRYRPRRSLPGPGTLLFGVSLVLLTVMAAVLFLRNSESAPGALEADAADDAPAGQAGVVAEGTQSPALDAERAATLFADAEARYREALDRDPDENRAAVLLVLRDAKDLANQALTADVERTLAPDINRLLSQIGREEDRLNRVRTVVTSATIGDFDSAGVGSAAEQMDVRVDAKYVIDATTGRVVSFETARQGATVLRKGDVVSSITVQDPIAVVNRALSVLVLDSRYNLVSLQADQNPRLLRITGTETWRTPVAFDNFNNNFYVLDPGANAIHKYQATAGGYEVAPSSYVLTTADIDLSSAIDMAIDGDIFVLLSDASVLRLRGGQRETFEISGLDGDSLKATRIFTEVDTDSLYLVDSANKRIVEIAKQEESAGEFVRQFKYAGSDDFFADIRSIWVSEIDGKLIVLGRDSVRQFVLPTIQDGA
ncbi:MAG: hypothetical protein OXG65_04580 [Chloroflexi bacterium]|nr:hypothetical protein [Chloroflexota bacterium]